MQGTGPALLPTAPARTRVLSPPQAPLVWSWQPPGIWDGPQTCKTMYLSTLGKRTSLGPTDRAEPAAALSSPG